MFCKTYGSTVGYIFILLWNICNDIPFNRATSIKMAALYENSEKTIADHAALLNLLATIYLQSKQNRKCL